VCTKIDAIVVFMFINSNGEFFPGSWKIIPGDNSQNRAAAMRGGAQLFIVYPSKNQFQSLNEKRASRRNAKKNIKCTY